MDLNTPKYFMCFISAFLIPLVPQFLYFNLGTIIRRKKWCKSSPSYSRTRDRVHCDFERFKQVRVPLHFRHCAQPPPPMIGRCYAPPVVQPQSNEWFSQRALGSLWCTRDTRHSAARDTQTQRYHCRNRALARRS